MRSELRLSARGHLAIEVWCGGEVTERDGDHNLILDSASAILTGALAGDAGKMLSAVAVGNDGTAPAGDQVGPVGMAATVPAVVTTPTPTQIVVEFVVLEHQANELGQVAEFVLLSADGTAYARRVRAPIAKTPDVELRGTWTIDILIEDGGA